MITFNYASMRQQYTECVLMMLLKTDLKFLLSVSSTLLMMIYCRLFTLPQKKTNSNCCTAALVVYILLFSASYYLYSPSTASGARYRRWACIDGHVEACGSGLLQLISVNKNWKHVLSQKVVTLNTCCDITCLTFQLPHVTTGSFQNHQCQPTTGSFESFQRSKERNNPSVR